MALEDTSQHTLAGNAEDGMDDKLIIDFGTDGKTGDLINTCTEVQIQTNCKQSPARLGCQCHNLSSSNNSEVNTNSWNHYCCFSNGRTIISGQTAEDYSSSNVSEETNHQLRQIAESASVGCCSRKAMNNPRLPHAASEADQCCRSHVCPVTNVESTLNADIDDLDGCAKYYNHKSIGSNYLPDLKKIQTDFDSLLDSVPSAAKRELLINTFIMYLMRRSNSNLQRIVHMEDAGREDNMQHTGKCEPSGDNVTEGSTCYGLSPLPVERLTNCREPRCQLMITSSPSPTDTSMALNLTIPTRRSYKPATALTDSWFCSHGEARFMNWPEGNVKGSPASLSVAAPPPAHCNVGSRDLTPNRAFTQFGYDSSRLSEFQPWNTNLKEESYRTRNVEDDSKKWSRDYNLDVDTMLCNSSAVKPAVTSSLTGGCDMICGKQGLLPLRVQLRSPFDISSLCKTGPDMSRNQSSLDTCNENAFAAAHAQLARANENPLAVKITSLPHSPVQPLAGSTFSVRVPIAPDVAVPVNYSSLLSVSDSCDDVPSPPKRYRSRKDPEKGYEKVHIKRPMNSFMCWAHIERPKLSKMFPSKNNADISRMLGEKWRKMMPEEKKPFEELSVKHSAQLLEKHPDYRYRPRRKEKGGTVESKLGQKKLQHQLCSSDTDPLICVAQSDSHYGAVAGLMSLNKSWISISNVIEGSEPNSAASTSSAGDTGLSITDRNHALPVVTMTSKVPSAVSLTTSEGSQHSNYALEAPPSTFDGIQVNM